METALKNKYSSNWREKSAVRLCFNAPLTHPDTHIDQCNVHQCLGASFEVHSSKGLEFSTQLPTQSGLSSVSLRGFQISALGIHECQHPIQISIWSPAAHQPPVHQSSVLHTFSRDFQPKPAVRRQNMYQTEKQSGPIFLLEPDFLVFVTFYQQQWAKVPFVLV